MTTQTGPCRDLPVRRRRSGQPLVRCLPAGHGRGSRPACLDLPGGDLRAPDATAVRGLLAAAARPGEVLVVDVSAVLSVDSAVVGVLLATDRRLRPTGGRLVLRGARPRVSRALQVAAAQGLLGR